MKRPSARLLRAAIVLGGVVPVSAGLFGAWEGARMFGASLPPGADSHFRYLSGLLLGIGLGFWSTVPQVERHAARFRLLTAIVVCGGLCRLLGAARGAPVDPGTGFALLMELAVTPLLCWWQSRVAGPAAPR